MEILRRQFCNADLARPLRHGVRDALRQALPTMVDIELMDDALIIVSELVQNVSQHTAGPGELVISLDTASVLIEVGDISTTVPCPRRPEPERSGGRGLLLIEALAQQWGVRTCPDGKAVWARLPAASNIPYPSAV
ncbi:hypothetical protein Aco03nite_100800 [Actinoplanes couchii]|uniref:Histidine kinase/HSP90-like ATPase domain-containing protein n=1 Tax=Actinoplanes couchii TaxID=403638 RepID=A0ABQ3XT36_9ACTN|nr:hypothetical protein Aco03nite_100800 [Actinoplanes couchii]